jgi:gamma-glutamyl hydrolase
MRHCSLWSAAVAGLLLAVACAAFPQQPQNPVIGIITHEVAMGGCGTGPTSGGPYDQCIESYYARWLEDAGIRVVPIPYNATGDEQEWWLSRVNGVLFQGGGRTAAQIEGPYLEMVQGTLKYALKSTSAGNPFVVWGTCQGFQVIAAAIANNVSAIEGPYQGMYPAMLPVNFTGNQPRSRLFGLAGAPSDVLAAMLNQNSTLNWHHEIVKPETFAHPAFADFRILATNVVPTDPSVTFITAYESTVAEIYAVQFHPERPPFEFSDDRITHSVGAISVSQYLANFIASRLKLNNNTFDTPQQAEDNSLARWPLVDQGWGQRTYFIHRGAPVQ